MHILLVHQAFAALDEAGGRAITNWPVSWSNAATG